MFISCSNSSSNTDTGAYEHSCVDQDKHSLVPYLSFTCFPRIPTATFSIMIRNGERWDDGSSGEYHSRVRSCVNVLSQSLTSRRSISNVSTSTCDFARQRYLYKLYVEGNPRSSMTSERIHMLDQLGMVWDSQALVWNARYDELLKYKSIHGHVYVTGVCIGRLRE
jgi:hypothetical protein